jgi:hypothetical protein
MANLETQIVDDIIVKSRRKLLTLGGAALAGMALATPRAAQAQSTYTDNDILNFALNLEYLEANFYYLAAFGTTIDVANTASTAAGAGVQTITGTGTQGTVTVKANPKVPFTTIAASSYCIETAVEEGKHVAFLRSVLGSYAVAQPAINLQASFNTLAAAATIGPAFDPFASDANFLVGAYIFEDVGVTAYHGAAPLITGKTTILPAAAGILAVEAYHAGLVRTTLNSIDPTGSMGLVGYTTLISALRAKLALAAASTTANPYDTNPDDYGIATFQVSLAGASSVTATRLVDADSTNVVAFARTTTQVLNIVTGGGAINGTAVVSPATGVFFPAGLNGLFK